MGEEKRVGWEEGGKTNTSSEILPKVTWRSYFPPQLREHRLTSRPEHLLQEI